MCKEKMNGALKYNSRTALVALGCSPYCPFGKAFVWNEDTKAYCCSYLSLTGMCCCCIDKLGEEWK